MSETTSEYMIIFDEQQCVQCFGCVVACSTWRQTPSGVSFRRVSTLWQGVFPEVKSSSLNISCLHCLRPSCLDVCPVEAITKRPEDGLVLVESELCIGCGACREACEYGVPQLENGGLMEKCDFCFSQRDLFSVPPCVDTCPSDALQLRQVTQQEKRDYEEKLKELLKKTIS